MGTLCAQLLLQFYIDQFETLQALFAWSVDVHVVFALSSIKVLLLFSTLELSHSWSLNGQCMLKGKHIAGGIVFTNTFFSLYI